MNVVLSNQDEQGRVLKATFLPNKGLNLSSYTLGEIEVIDQSTRQAFEDRYGGLGPLIGPHFHRRNPAIIPPVKEENLFPHITKAKEYGSADPFSHGIGRYAPWKIESTQTSLKGTLSSSDLWEGVPLGELEGQNFKMTYAADLTQQGLKIELSVVSAADSLVGIHYYYHLPDGKGRIRSRVQDVYREGGQKKRVPTHWMENGMLSFDLTKGIDCTFYPAPDPLKGQITLETGTYKLVTSYQCCCQENSWQLYHPAGASYVCIEPISSQDPHHPNLTVSSLSIQLMIIA